MFLKLVGMIINIYLKNSFGCSLRGVKKLLLPRMSQPFQQIEDRLETFLSVNELGNELMPSLKFLVNVCIDDFLRLSGKGNLKGYVNEIHDRTIENEMKKARAKVRSEMAQKAKDSDKDTESEKNRQIYYKALAKEQFEKELAEMSDSESDTKSEKDRQRYYRNLARESEAKAFAEMSDSESD